MSDLPATVDLRAYRGDSWTQTFRFLADGAPVDLSDAGAVECWCARHGEHFTMPATGNADGVVTIELPVPAAEFDAGSYVYDVEVTKDGTVTTWVRGRLTVEQDVTNAA